MANVYELIKKKTYSIIKKIPKHPSREITNKEIQILLYSVSSTSKLSESLAYESVCNMLTTISKEEMEVIKLMYWYCMPIRSIAAKINKSKSAVNKMHQSALNKMRSVTPV